jgi:hypothetical protein
MGPFPKSWQCEYILVAVDYVSKWVEALPCRAADSNNAMMMFFKTIFPRFGVPRFLSDHGVCHNIMTPYHAQTSGQAETSNKQIKNILQKIVNEMGMAWKDKLHGALWAYKIAYKTPLRMSPHQLVYGKTCHLPIELEFKAHCANVFKVVRRGMATDYHLTIKLVRRKARWCLNNLRKI